MWWHLITKLINVNQRRSIRRRGNSFQVLVYAGIDPLTGQRMYLSDSATGEVEAERIRRRLLAQVDDQRNARTRATLGMALEAWLKTHDAEETTLDGYRGYVRRNIFPALGGVPIGKVSAQLLEEFYAELRRCRHRCRDGGPAVDHRTTVEHECRRSRRTWELDLTIRATAGISLARLEEPEERPIEARRALHE